MPWAISGKINCFQIYSGMPIPYELAVPIQDLEDRKNINPDQKHYKWAHSQGA